MRNWIWTLSFFVGEPAWAADAAITQTGSAQIIYSRIDDAPSAEAVRFIATRTASYELAHRDEANTLSLLVVYVGAGRDKAAGVSHFILDQKIDCAANAVTTQSYATLAADGKLIARAKFAPAEALALASGPAIDRHWRSACRLATGGSTPILTDSRMLSNPTYLARRHANDVPAALALAHEREVGIAEAKRLPEAGRYWVLGADRKQGVMLVDATSLAQSGDVRHVSWLTVPAARTGSAVSYMRLRYSVDCAQRQIAGEMKAEFDVNGELIKFEGPGRETAADQSGGLGAFLLETCTLEGPGAFDRTYATFTEALAAGRKELAR